MMRSRLTGDVEVRQSPIDGRGVFALRRFRRGETILRWNVATRVPRENLDRLSAEERRYLHPFDESTLLVVQSPERYVNHSCENNSEVRDFSDVAIRDIAPGEEITSDYGADGAGQSFDCRCGTPSCRGRIGSPKAMSAAAEESTLPVLETERLVLRRLTTDDAQFMLELLNDPAFIEHIGDKGVRTVADAQAYLLSGPIASYGQFGYGLYRVELRESGERIGMCGLLKRESLPDTDIGFAYLPRFRSQGYALEAAAAVLDYARRTVGLKRILAIVSPANERSIRLLEKLGLSFERMVQMSADEPPIKLLARDF